MFPDIRIGPYKNFVWVRFLLISCDGLNGFKELTSSKSSDVITLGGGTGAGGGATLCRAGFVDTPDGVEVGFARS